MNEIPFLNDIQKFNKQFQKKKNEYFKVKFSKYIKITFLFKIFEEIKKRTNDLSLLLPYYHPIDPNDMFNILAGGDPVEYDICKQIVFIHRYNMGGYSDEEKSKYQNDKKYIDKIVEQVIQQIKVRRYAGINFKINEMYSLERFEYYPPIYYLHVLTYYLGENMDKYIGKLYDKSKDEYLKVCLEGIINKLRGVMSVITVNMVDCGYSILRGIIELYIIFICLKYSTIDSKIYANFSKYKEFYDKNNYFDPDFEVLYNKKSKNIGITDYLNYGWLDSIFEFDYLGIKKQYKFNDLLKLAEFITKKDKAVNQIILNIRNYYYKCHIYTHGFPLLEFTNQHLYDLSNPLSEILLGVAHEIQNKIVIEDVNGVNIVKALVDANLDFKRKFD